MAVLTSAIYLDKASSLRMEFNPPAFQIDYEVVMMEAILHCFPIQSFGASCFILDSVSFKMCKGSDSRHTSRIMWTSEKTLGVSRLVIFAQ